MQRKENLSIQNLFTVVNAEDSERLALMQSMFFQHAFYNLEHTSSKRDPGFLPWMHLASINEITFLQHFFEDIK